MFICKNCFRDYEVQARINRAEKIGYCSFCGDKNAYVYNTDEDTYLEDDFTRFFDMYLVVDDGIKDVLLLKDDIVMNWNIFDGAISVDDVPSIFKEICK